MQMTLSCIFSFIKQHQKRLSIYQPYLYVLTKFLRIYLSNTPFVVDHVGAVGASPFIAYLTVPAVSILYACIYQ